MFHHGPSSLPGPVTRAQSRWLCPTDATAESAQGQHRKQADHTGRSPKEADRPIRTELVARIRREIADGTYETPEKWDAALEKLLEDLQEQ